MMVPDIPVTDKQYNIILSVLTPVQNTASETIGRTEGLQKQQLHGAIIKMLNNAQLFELVTDVPDADYVLKPEILLNNVKDEGRRTLALSSFLKIKYTIEEKKRKRVIFAGEYESTCRKTFYDSAGGAMRNVIAVECAARENLQKFII